MDENQEAEPTPKSGMNPMYLIGGLIVLAIVGGLGWMLLSNNSSKPSDTSQTQTAVPSSTEVQNSPPAAENTESAVKEFTVEGTSFKFTPATMTVKEGDKVRIVFKNTGGLHDFVIDEFNVATKQINGGEEETVEFVASKSGTYEYYCSVGKHRQMGMKGTLTVEPKGQS